MSNATFQTEKLLSSVLVCIGLATGLLCLRTVAMMTVSHGEDVIESDGILGRRLSIHRLQPILRAAFVALSMSTLYACPLSADDGSERSMEAGKYRVRLTGELQAIRSFYSDPTVDAPKQIFSPRFEAETTLGVTSNLTLHSRAALELIGSADGTSTGFPRRYGLATDEFYLRWHYSSVSLRAGKFEPVFGRDDDITSGVFEDYLVDGYKLDERLGLSARWHQARSKLGKLTATAAAYFVDTTLLSDTLITSRGRTTRAEGGPSNTGGLTHSLRRLT